MASPPPPWTDAEKNFILAELIKQAAPPPAHLFNFLQSLNNPPRLHDIPLPPGRSYSETNQAFDTIKRGALNFPPTAFGVPQTPSPASTTTTTLKRPFPYSESYSSNRPIQPKPSSGGPAYINPSPIEQPPKKKRGRPTKAEAAARAEAQQTSTSEPGSAPRRQVSQPVGHAAPSRLSISAASADPPSPEHPPAQENRPPITSSSRMLLSSIVTPTAPKADSQSSSSSGKRRRVRSMRTSEAPQTTQYQSPYAITTAEDSPARTAVMRHRDEVSSLPPPRMSGTGGGLSMYPVVTSPSLAHPPPPPPSSSEDPQ